jgi:glycosyltransferase involved in cell wall biosynthesis
VRIAQLAPIANPVCRGAGDSVEQLVWLLTEELVRRGHEVTLFATGDSSTSARLRATYRQGYEHDEALWDWRFHEFLHAAGAFEHAAEFDVIHSHSYHFGLPFSRLTETAVLNTYPVEMDRDIADAYRRYPEARVVAVSRFQRQQLAELPNVAVVPHGIDTAAFPFSAEQGEYLLFLGRMIEDKGPREAIAIARELDIPLVMAGAAGDYFTAQVAPLVVGSVSYVGVVDAARRNELLAGAAALLFPVTYPEPFGLVMIEAMACGTPVAAVALGAVPEIVDEGVTGHCAESAAELAGVVPATVALDRGRIRRVAEERFDFRRMVDGYEALYRQAVEERR